MVGIETGTYQEALASFGRTLRPSAIVAVSAHWGTSMAIAVSGAERYEAVHDFGGFPAKLYDLRYSPSGSPALAGKIAATLKTHGWTSDLVENRGLDHGVWIPLRFMYPAANVPLVQLSLPLRYSAQQLFDVGKLLAPLRQENMLVLGSGGIVHNLQTFHGGSLDQPIEPWAAEFDGWFAAKLEQHDVDSLLRYRELAPHADLAVPTFEHFAPVFVTLGAAANYEKVDLISTGFQYGAISMRSFAIG